MAASSLPRRSWPRRVLRGVLWGLAGLITVLTAFAGGFYAYLQTGLPQTSGPVTVPGLSRPVEVWRDRDGVPHIFAQDLDDAWTALGYLHAQDRLYQMEMGRRIARGRLAELVGSPVLSFDRQMRTFDLPSLAAQSFALAEPETRRAVEAYSRGVNAWIANRKGALPFEFYLLWFSPEPWTPIDSLLWGRTMALLLSGGARQEAMEARIDARVSATDRAILTAPDRDPPSIPGRATVLPGERVEAPAIDPVSLDRAMAATLQHLPPWFGTLLASNGWAVAGNRTTTGAPILVNDPHLGLMAPGTWYLARIVTPDHELVGATAPGVPFHVLGQNRHLAWGMTTTGADTQDLVLERETRPGFYATPDGEAPFRIREEQITVRFGAPVTQIVRATRHGPVVSDLGQAEAPPGYVVALQATGLRGDDRTADAMRRFNLARSWTEFDTALTLYHAPVQNLIVADQTRIALAAPGRLPIRSSGDGTKPLPGWTGEATWTGFVAPGDVPRQVDPDDGAVWNANNRLVGADYPYLVTSRWADPHRGRRLQALLAEPDPYSLDLAERHVLDIASPLAAELLPLLLAEPGGSPAAEAARRQLRAWNREMAPDRPEPAIWAAWTHHLHRLVFEPMLGDLYRESFGPRATALVAALQQSPAARAAVVPALEAALGDLTQRLGADPAAWRWSAVHVARMGHPVLGRIPVLNRLARIEVATPGGDDTLNRGQTAGRRGQNPYAHVHGAGYRAIYDVADPARSRFAVATGQSGQPYSRHWQDLTGPWAAGQHRTITGTPDDLARAGGQRLQLLP